MTTHTPAPAQQALLTDEEIRAVWVEHGLDDEAVEDFARAIESALLSKLRAPVADERRALFALKHIGTWAGVGAGMKTHKEVREYAKHNAQACADAAVMGNPMSIPPVVDKRPAVAYLDLGAGGYMDMDTDLTDEQLAALPKGRHMLAIIGTHGVNGYTPAAVASAPVAGEAQPLGYVRKGREWPNQCYYPSSHKPTDIHNWTPVFDHAAPQPSGDAGIAASDHERNAALEALEAAQRFIRNGIEFGYIRMPDADTPDPAHRTPGLIDAAIRSLKSQADKDGGQQRAGDVSAEAHKAALLEVERVGIELAARLHEAAMSLETISQIAGRPGKDMETMDDVRGYAHSRARAARAALSATQAEQGERDA